MKTQDMNRRLIIGVAVLFSAGIATQEAKADNLNILISTSGTDYYQWTNVTVGSNSYSSNWLAQTPSQTNWDDMATSPGGSGSNTYTTQYFSLGYNNTGEGGLPFTVGGQTVSVGPDSGGGYWRTGNVSNDSDAGLIVTNPGTPTSSSTVQNLLVLDGVGGIYLYKTPTLAPITSDVTNSNTSGLNAYAYISGSSGSWSQTSPPITQLGTVSSGLEGDLENNGGFAGNGNGSNILTGGQTTVSLPGGPTGSSFIGYEFGGGNNVSPEVYSFREFVNGSFGGGSTFYVTPTIYVDEGSVPEPGSLGLLGLGAMGLLSRGRKKIAKA
jgi:PEP-CTERM motif